MQVTFDELKHSAVTCPDGMAHKWAYLGKDIKTAGTYLCERCGVVITKEVLKAKTD